MHQKTINTVRAFNQEETRNPIDLIVFYHISTKNINNSSGKKKLVRVSLNALDIETGKPVVHDDGSNQQASLIGRDANENDWITQRANLYARDSAAFIGERLTSYIRIFDYELVMRDFTSSEILDFKNALSKHPSYEAGQLKLKETSNTRRYLFHFITNQSYYLKSSMGGGQLQAFMHSFLEEESISATTHYGMQTNGVRSLDITRKGVAFINVYILAGVCILLLLLAGFYRKHERTREHFKNGLRKRLIEAKAAIANQNIYLALNNIDAALFSIKGLDGFKAELKTLNDMRLKTLAMIKAKFDLVELEGAMAGVTLLSKPTLLIGRPDSSINEGIEINFKRISRVGKQCKLEKQGESFVISDLNSTHGTAVGGRFLVEGERIAIKKSQVLALGGSRKKNTAGPCRIILEPLLLNDALLISFDQPGMTLMDQTSLSLAWPMFDADIQKKWACFSKEFPVSEVEGELELGALVNGEALFYFTYDNGFGVKPATLGETSCLKIDGIEILGDVPLQSGSELIVNQHRILIR